MQAYEFSSVVEDKGVIHIPEQYLKNISSPVKIILITNEENSQNTNKHFSAISLRTKKFKFDRETANER